MTHDGPEILSRDRGRCCFFCGFGKCCYAVQVGAVVGVSRSSWDSSRSGWLAVGCWTNLGPGRSSFDNTWVTQAILSYQSWIIITDPAEKPSVIGPAREDPLLFHVWLHPEALKQAKWTNLSVFSLEWSGHAPLQLLLLQRVWEPGAARRDDIFEGRACHDGSWSWQMNVANDHGKWM